MMDLLAEAGRQQQAEEPLQTGALVTVGAGSALVQNPILLPRL
jgi:hypothetical protein